MSDNDEIKMLSKKIDEIDRISDENWKLGLNVRKKLEMEFHDRDRDKKFLKVIENEPEVYQEFYGNKKYYNTTRRSNEFIHNWIKKEVTNKVFLDYACGNGDYAFFAAEYNPAISLGFDISPVSVNNANEKAKVNNISNIRFFQADAEDTKLPSNSIDVILCSGMLHHLDLSYAFPEMRRILKPGGKILAVEALDINPLIKLYRRRTPKMRTAWESKHILSLKDVKFSRRFFELEEIKYWHVIGYVGGKFPFLLNSLEKLDLLLEKIPFIQRFAWIFTFELVKKD